jgi:hypothetical protein
MEKIFTILAAIILTASVFAQAPERMSYQAVIRDNNGNLVTNNVVGVRLSLLQGSVTGNEVYKELFNPNPETIDREIGWAADIGMNIMRVYLHHVAWKVDPDGFKQRVDEKLREIKFSLFFHG